MTKIDLHIDTVDYGRVKFMLTGQKQNFQKVYKIIPQESDKVLEILEKFLKSAKISNQKSEIEKIILYKGAGSFTGLRVGAAIADALSLAWQVPVKIVSK